MLVLTFIVVLSGCGQYSAIEFDRSPQPVTTLGKKNSVQGVAFEFVTPCDEYITVIQDTENDVSYKVPTDILDPRMASTPIQIRKGNYIIDVGYANADVGSSIDDNLYAVIYDAVVQSYITKTEGNITDELRALLLNYKSVYPNKVYRSSHTFTGADSTVSKWSDSVIDFSLYTNIEAFKFPIVTCTYPLKSGEYLVAHCYATLDSGMWFLDNLPAYLDVATKPEYENKTTDDYMDYIVQMQEAYNECVNFLQTELPNICIGDLSDTYTIVSLSNTTSDNYTYGVDVSMYDKYAFIVLSDSSVYLVYEKNGVRALECIAGDSTHNLSTNWDKYDTKIADSDTKEVYNFTWKTN